MASAAEAATQILAGTAYASTTSDQSLCGIVTSLIKVSTNVALGGTWLTIDGSGNVSVDKQVAGTVTVLVRYTYANLASADTTSFVVTVNCPALTEPTVTTTSYTNTIATPATGSATTKMAANLYVTNNANTY